MKNRLIYREILTERLKMRDVQQDDYIHQFKFLSDKSKFPYADYKIAKTLTDVRLFFDKMTQNHLKTSLFWMICDKNTNIPLGHISAWNVDEDANSIEFGYSIYSEHRGKGYMKEALKAVIDFCVYDMNFDKLDIWTHKDNVPSLKLAESLGFKFQGNVIEKAKNSQEDVIYATFRKTIKL